MIGKRSHARQQKKIEVVANSDSDSGLEDSITEAKKFRPTAHSTPKSTPRSLKDKLERYAAPTVSSLLMPPPSLPDAQPQTPSSPSSPIPNFDCSQSQETGLETDFDSDSHEDEVSSSKKPLNMQKVLSDAHEKDASGSTGKMDDRIGMKRSHTEEVMEQGKCIHIHNL